MTPVYLKTMSKPAILLEAVAKKRKIPCWRDGNVLRFPGHGTLEVVYSNKELRVFRKKWRVPVLANKALTSPLECIRMVVRNGS